MPLVLVHGNPEIDAIWDELREHLQREDVVALSPPGFGAPVTSTSPGWPASWSGSTDRLTWSDTTGAVATSAAWSPRGRTSSVPGPPTSPVVSTRRTSGTSALRYGKHQGLAKKPLRNSSRCRWSDASRFSRVSECPVKQPSAAPRRSVKTWGAAFCLCTAPLRSRRWLSGVRISHHSARARAWRSSRPRITTPAVKRSPAARRSAPERTWPSCQGSATGGCVRTRDAGPTCSAPSFRAWPDSGALPTRFEAKPGSMVVAVFAILVVINATLMLVWHR